MKRTKHLLFELQQHSGLLSTLLSTLWQADPVTVIYDEETLEFNDAAEWLDLAAGVLKVEVLTGRFDDSLAWCGTARRYEDARSDLLSNLATCLSVFSFIWGGFETVAKVVSPPDIPKTLRANGANGLIDKAIYHIRDCKIDFAYTETLAQLNNLITATPSYSKLIRETVPAHMAQSGLGIVIVRKIRNRFAHGTASLPVPDDCKRGWCGNHSPVPLLIVASSKIVLLTIQMLLSVHYSKVDFKLRGVLEDEDGFIKDESIHVLLSNLHDAACVVEAD